VPPSHVDVGFHIVSHDNEFRRKAVVIGAKAHDVDLSHSGRKDSEKLRGEQEGLAWSFSLTEFSKQPTIGTQLRLRRDRGTSDNPQIGKFNRLRFWILRDL
jgi:hypothetical protein